MICSLDLVENCVRTCTPRCPVFLRSCWRFKMKVALEVFQDSSSVEKAFSSEDLWWKNMLVLWPNLHSCMLAFVPLILSLHGNSDTCTILLVLIECWYKSLWQSEGKKMKSQVSSVTKYFFNVKESHILVVPWACLDWCYDTRVLGFCRFMVYRCLWWCKDCSVVCDNRLRC